jgi:hypothetical protein
MSEVKQPVIGQHVVFTDAHGMGHPALLTAVHGTATSGWNPAVNLVFVTEDTSKTDPYGRQIERHTSVVHRMQQSAHGMFWTFPDEA